MVKVFSANFAFGDKNPFNSVKFYNGNNYKGKRYLLIIFYLDCHYKSMKEVSTITPSVF